MATKNAKGNVDCKKKEEERNLKEEIMVVLDELKKKKPTDQTGAINPSTLPPNDIKIPFNTETNSKKKAVKDSFHPAILDVGPDKRHVTNDKKNLGSPQAVKNSGNPETLDVTKDETNPGSPQEKGKQEHREFADLINNGDRTGKKGKVLSELEDKYRCKFLRAEVDIWGWSIQKSKKTFYMGKMDAVAFCPNEPAVLIVDWKTSAQKGTDSLRSWWNGAGNFGGPLYQTLVYRKLLTKHLKRLKVDIKVGIMLVPYHQSNEEFLMPGLCVNFSKMEKEGLLNGLKQYRWVCEESEICHNINFPGCKMFKNLEELYNLKCVDEKTGLLKKDALLIDVISHNATIADLAEEMGLLSLKVTGNAWEEEGRRRKEDEEGLEEEDKKKEKE